MIATRTSWLARAGLLLGALALGACADGGDPVTPTPVPAPGPVELAQLTCTANVSSPSVRCGGGTLNADARGLVVGNQGVYVQLTSGTPSYNAGTGAFTFTVTVQNLIPQPMGTTDGSSASPTGVRVVFAQNPAVSAGTGTVTFTPDGTGAFTAADQSYYQYSGALLGADGILSQNETSAAKSWTFNVPASASAFTFVVYVAADVPNPNGYIDVTPGAPKVLAGTAQALSATVRSAVGNPVPGQTITWGTTNAAVATVDAAGNVTAVAPGTASITATAGARSGQAAISVCPNLAVGGAYVVTSGSFCLGTGAGASEYTVVPVSLTQSSIGYTYVMTASGVVPASGAPTPDLIPAPRAGARAVPKGPRADEGRHLAMLREQRRQAARLGRPSLVRRAQPGARRSITPGVPAVGAVMNLNVSDFYCTSIQNRPSTVRAVGTHIIILEDNSNPATRPSAADYQQIAATFDTLVWPAVAGNFGAPFDIDGNGRVVALYTAAVNDLSDPGSGSYVGGFFYSRDMFGTNSCAGSNQGEMFYLLAADPTGSHGIDWSVAEIKEQTIGVLGHEFQHLINASRRLYGNAVPAEFETVWLDEGLAHIAEEHIYYAASHHGPGENLDADAVFANATQEDRFFEFAESNFGRLREWLQTPGTYGPFSDNDELATRGATWAFLRYAADRRGGTEGTLWSAMAIGPDTGLVNLNARLGTNPRPWIRDWAAAMYADDAGIGAAATYTQPSWNFRDIYTNLDYLPGAACSCAYELSVRGVVNGVGQSVQLAPGGASGYVRLGVPAASFATVSGSPPGASLGVVVVRRK